MLFALFRTLEEIYASKMFPKRNGWLLYLGLAPALAAAQGWGSAAQGKGLPAGDPGKSDEEEPG